MINICNRAKDQNNISIISVETRKEETETAGIRKKDVAVKSANSKLLYNFFEIKKII